MNIHPEQHGTKAALPEELQRHFPEVQPAIQQRLKEFSQVPREEYFYELCFCLCTPQSKAVNAERVVNILKERDFRRQGFDPVDILRDPAHYIRFHRTKANRLMEVRGQFPEIDRMLASGLAPEEKRLWLVEHVKGMGMKEAAHFLRNIGYRDLGILDRHILKHLVQCGVFAALPAVGTAKRYREVEDAFRAFAAAVHIPMDELDLFFWYLQAGEILK